MKHWRLFGVLVLIALGPAALAVASWPSGNLEAQRALEAAPGECDSCTLRHQRLGKNAEERAEEAALLKELHENSTSDQQTE